MPSDLQEASADRAEWVPDAVAAADAENGVAFAAADHKADAAAASPVAAADAANGAEEWLEASELGLAAAGEQAAVAVAVDVAVVHTSDAEAAAKAAAGVVVVADSGPVPADVDGVKMMATGLPFVTCWPSVTAVVAYEEREHHSDDLHRHKEMEDQQDRVTGSECVAVVSCHDTGSKDQEELADFVPAGDKHRSVLSSVRSVTD